VLSRASSTYEPEAGVKLLKTDYTHESLVTALKGQDAVVSAIGGAGVSVQTKVIDAAIAAGVKRFIPSEFGSDTTNPLTLEYFPGWAQKVEIRKYLESKQDQIEYTAIFNGLFFDWYVNRTPVQLLKMVMNNRVSACSGALKWASSESIPRTRLPG
jgi:hypothetical protein